MKSRNKTQTFSLRADISDMSHLKDLAEWLGLSKTEVIWSLVYDRYKKESKIRYSYCIVRGNDEFIIEKCSDGHDHIAGPFNTYEEAYLTIEEAKKIAAAMMEAI